MRLKSGYRAISHFNCLAQCDNKKLPKILGSFNFYKMINSTFGNEFFNFRVMF